MLTALNDNQKLISLIHLSSEDMVLLQKTEKFFCPECKSPLILKKGNIKIPHFAHQSGGACTGTHEPETSIHLKGKTSLYQHFSKSDFKVNLEHYLPVIQQRPDLFIQDKNRQFAVEFQCSEISSLDFISRTRGYQQEKIIPIWVLGKPIKKLGAGPVISLSNFQQHFIRFSPHTGFWLAVFDTVKDTMFFYYHLFPLSSKKFTAVTTSIPLHSLTFPFQLPIQQANHHNSERFFAGKALWVKNKMKYNRGVNDRFLRTLYLARDHLIKLPDFIGLPTKFMIVFKNHPVEWQYYIWNDILKKKTVGERIGMKEIQNCINQRKISGYLQCRSMPLIDEEFQMNAVEEYLVILCKRDILKRNSNREYILVLSALKKQ
ncbi:competence protein CoiA [Bacillus sp. AK031]